jgi:hypothetical protein
MIILNFNFQKQMQVIYIKTLKTFALIIMFFLTPSTSLRVNSKRNKKTPGCRPHPGPLRGRGGQVGVFCSLIFARLRYAKIYAKRKKVEPEFNKARPDLLFNPSVSHEQTRCRFG